MPATLVTYIQKFWKMLEMDFYDNRNGHCWLTTKQLGMPIRQSRSFWLWYKHFKDVLNISHYCKCVFNLSGEEE